MVTSVMPKREVGRPRMFEDDQIYRAVARAVNQLGYRRLTVAAIADEVGCTGPALIHRFGSRNSLLRSFLDWSTERSHERFQAVRLAHASPLAALRARMLIPLEERMEEVGDRTGHAAFLSFYIEGRDDPEFAPAVDHHARMFEGEMACLLDQADTAGELIACDRRELAHALLAGIAGASLMWSSVSDRSLFEEVARVFDVIIAPYRPYRP